MSSFAGAMTALRRRLVSACWRRNTFALNTFAELRKLASCAMASSSYLAKKFSELLFEFRKIAEVDSTAA